MKNILIAFECSGIAREAFAKKYPDAKVTSVDLLPSEIPCSKNAQHWQTDIKDALFHSSGNPANGDDDGPWDLIVAFVPCDHLAVSGARWFPEKRSDGRQRAAIEMFLMIAEYPVEHICIENPVGIMSGEMKYLKKYYPDLYERAKKLPVPQIVQPWMFGHTETKKTCLWLKNLPYLNQTNNVYDEMMKLPKKDRNKVHYMSPRKNRAKDRARTYPGVANAMADQFE